jgi:serine/threonine-protein kinase
MKSRFFVLLSLLSTFSFVAALTLASYASATPAASPGVVLVTFPSTANLAGVTLDDSGNVYTADATTGDIYKMAGGTGTPTSLGSVSGDHSYQAIHYHAGYLYVSLWQTSTIYRLDLSNVVGGWSSFITSGINHPQDMTWDTSGNIYITNYSGSSVVATASSSGGAATDLGVTGLTKPEGIVILGSTLYLVDNVNYELFSVPLAGHQVATANTTLPVMSYPWSMSTDSAGNIYIGDYGNGIVEVPADGSTPYFMNVTGVVATEPAGVTWSNGYLYEADVQLSTPYNWDVINKISAPSSTPTTSPSTTPTLAATGTNLNLLLGVAAVFAVFGGVGVFEAQRRRRRA